MQTWLTWSKGKDVRKESGIIGLGKNGMDMEISVGSPMIGDGVENSRKASKRSRAGIIAANDYTGGSSFARRG